MPFIVIYSRFSQAFDPMVLQKLLIVYINSLWGDH
jgi:hypothetical protein